LQTSLGPFSQAKRSDIYANLSAEWWSTVAQLIERRQVIIPNDEKLVAQLTSRRKLYDSRGREKLESKADLRARGAESPDRADALIGAIVLGAERLQSALSWQECREINEELKRRRYRQILSPYGLERPHIEWR
jgi:phage terminase large subunit